MNNKLYNQLELTLEANGKSPGTVREYALSIKHLERYFENRDLSKLSESDLINYAQYLIAEGYSKTTYNNRIAAVRYLYTKVLNKKINLEKLPLQRIRELNVK